MNKISIYVLLVLIFLGLSKNFSLSRHGSQYISNERVFSDFFPGAPLSIILVDSFKVGFLIKTYFQKYRVVHGFNNQPQTIIVRTSRDFWNKNNDNIGMSLFRRKEINLDESVIPMPPGSLYIGDPAYGNWRTHRSGEKQWVFHRAYQNFPNFFFWGDFKPSYEFYQKLKIHAENEKIFKGLNGEFGRTGYITQKNIVEYQAKFDNEKNSFKQLFSSYLQFPSWRSQEEKNNE